ncbi:MAG: TolC family protein [Litorilituus sp.]|jgi:NodT family efflux transporter outer membrane factor (OMF) lipoprotein|nr:TolC family protein [Litorilituus sp.]
MSTSLFSCSSTDELNIDLPTSYTPGNWSTDSDSLTSQIKENWFEELQNDQIHQLVELALKQNFQLKQQALAIDIKKQQLIIAGSALWPSLDVGLSGNRRKVISNSATSYSTNVSLDLNLKYELDLWGKLSDSEQQANLELMAQQASYTQAKQQLVADVIIAWFSAIEANQLVVLYKKRAHNTQQNLLIIESGYQQGLNSALDVYLSRNEVNNELARITEQQTKKTLAIRQLEQLLGEYPTGKLLVEVDLPEVTSNIPLGLPSELVTRKPELLASWYQLLAKNSALAYAHKQRFPSVSLMASISDEQDDVSDLLSSSLLGWSLLGNLAMPIFNAGKLEANEERTRIELKQAEQGYLSTLHTAFVVVENAVTQEASLNERYQVMLKAQLNAIAAQTLSFEQYQSGLVNYTTVLDAQSRSYDAQSTVIQLQNQLIINRVNLHIALGGNFSESSITESNKRNTQNKD